MQERKKKIMIIDDDPVLSVELKYTLEDFGYEVSSTATGADEAVEKAREFTPDLMLMDVSLAGGKNGIEVARQIQSFLKIPVIFLTGYCESDIQKKIRDIWGCRLISKPFDIAELHKLMAQLLK